MKAYNISIVLVSANAVGSAEFMAYYLQGCASKKFARAVVDEAHNVITASALRSGPVWFLAIFLPNLPELFHQRMNLPPSPSQRRLGGQKELVSAVYKF
jgi:hypothetical protein